MTRLQLRRGLAKARSAFVADSLVFFMAYLVIISGIPIMIDPSIFAPLTIQTHLSDWIIRLWGFDLAAGGLLSGYGLLSERPLIERAGQACLFAGSLIFAVVLLVSTGWFALLPCLTYFFFAASTIARFHRLGQVQEGIELARRLNGGK